MTSDSYQLCPGGTGKKLKFCCADLVHEIPKLEKLIDSEQRLACLDQIQRLEEKFPGRACLLTLKMSVQSMLGRAADAEQTIRSFHQAHPENAIALSQAALLAAQEGRLPEAVAMFGEAMQHCPQEMPQIVYQSLSVLAEQLLAAQEMLAALAVLRAQVAFAPQDPRARQVLGSLERAAQVPLLFRDDTFPELDPQRAGLSGQPQHERYLDAMRHMFHVRYALAIADLEPLCGEDRAAAEVWRTLGYLRSYALDTTGSTEALRKFAALRGNDDDAVEAEALAQLLGNEDDVEHLFVEYVVHDADQVATALTASKQAIPLPVDPRMAEPGEPPPREVFAITNRPVTDDSEVAAANVPLVIARVGLFGKQTDRDARLEISVSRWNLPALQELLQSLLPNSLGAPSGPEVVARQRLTAELSRAELQLPRGLTPARTRELQREVLSQRVLEVWPKMALSSLGGQTPQEAARSPDKQLALRAALLNLQLEIEPAGALVDFAALRQQLGLPAAAQLVAAEVDVERLPLARFNRLEIRELSDEQLTALLERASTYQMNSITRQAALEVIARPALLAKLGSQRIYFSLSMVCEDPDEAVKYINQGRQAAGNDPQSTMVFDLQELEIRVSQRNMPEVERLLNVVLKNYGNQPGIREAVAQMLMSAGIMVAPPDMSGRPGAMPPPGATPEPPADSGGIWTPDSARGGSQKSSLWTPGMD